MNENNPLYAQKVTILSRLIKESSLTLEEALVLLKEEEPEEIEETSSVSSWIPGTATPYTPNYYGSSGFPLSGTMTIPANSFHFTNGVSSATVTTTSTADLNN